MAFAAILSGQDSPERRAASPSVVSASLPCPAASATSVSGLRALCVSTLSWNFQLSAVNLGRSAQLSCFQILPYSWTTTQLSPFCFHDVTYSSSCKASTFTYLSKYWGCTPLSTALSEPTLELQPLTFSPPVACSPREKQDASAGKHSAAALTHPPAPAYNACSLMTDRGTEFILGPPRCWRAAQFLGTLRRRPGCGLYLQRAMNK